MTAARDTALPRLDVVGSLYVIEIGTDRIKVGWSGNPAARLKSHRAAARAYGAGAGREWISPPRANLVTETALIDFCAARATEQIGKEYFIGVRFEDAVEHATGLVADDPAPRLLLASLPSEALQRLLSSASLPEVAREPGVLIYVIEDDGTHRRVLAGDPQ